jgi:prepilin signal peptidase PulO-like enzyme (type II secretory pathway)
MKAYQANLINSITLIALSVWAYYSSHEPSFTALIPAAFGAVLAGLTKGVKVEDKILSHIAVVLTLLLFGALFMPLKGVLGRGDAMGIARVLIMMGTTLLALVFFVKSFVEARQRRAYKNNS